MAISYDPYNNPPPEGLYQPKTSTFQGAPRAAAPKIGFGSSAARFAGNAARAAKSFGTAVKPFVGPGLTLASLASVSNLAGDVLNSLGPQPKFREEGPTPSPEVIRDILTNPPASAPPRIPRLPPEALQAVYPEVPSGLTMPTQQIEAATPIPPRPRGDISSEEWQDAVNRQALDLNLNPTTPATTSDTTPAGSAGFRVNEQGVYVPAPGIAQSRNISTIGMRRPATAVPTTAVPVHAPSLAPVIETPDYSGVIDQLISQATKVSRNPSFDAKIAAKQQRAAALGALREVGGMRGQDVQAAIQQANIQQGAQQGAAQRQFEARRAEQDLLQRQAEQDIAAQQFGQTLGMRREEARLSRADTLAQRDAQAANQAAVRDLQERQFGLTKRTADLSVIKDAANYLAGVQKEERAAKEETARRQTLADAYLASIGGKLDSEGNVVTGWLSNVDMGGTTKYNAILQGLDVPKDVLFNQ